jgi:hypothetical protein
MNFRNYRWTLVATLLLSALLAVPALAGFQETKSFGGSELTVNNLIGEIRVAGHSGSDFEITVNVQGGDASEDRVAIRQDGDQLSVVFPVSESRKYVYPALGRGSRTSFTPNKNEGWLSQVIGSMSGRRIEVTGSGSGLEVWADIEIRVPTGSSLTVNHGVGEVFAEGTDGDIELSTHSGAITANELSGRIVLDTGSGHVEAADIDGRLVIDTGSGHVEARRITAEDVSIDTGSGHVEIEEVDGRNLSIDTGSGRVEARSISADDVSIDTGSGSVKLYLDRMGNGDFSIDTGSGGITLAVPAGASARVTAETGSGGIDLDLTSAEIRISHKEDDEVSFTIGNGDARIDLDTGSGGIRVIDN